jgi:putative transposase
MCRIREIRKSAVYKIAAKINRGEKIFEDEKVRDLFLLTIKRAKDKYKFNIKDIELREDFVSFIIKPGRCENLPIIMRWILSVFAANFNNSRKIRGHVWAGKYISVIVDK